MRDLHLFGAGPLLDVFAAASAAARDADADRVIRSNYLAGRLRAGNRKQRKRRAGRGCSSQKSATRKRGHTEPFWFQEGGYGGSMPGLQHSQQAMSSN